VPVNKLHDPAPSSKPQDHAFLALRRFDGRSVAGSHPVAEMNEYQFRRQTNQVRSQDTVRLYSQRTGKVGLILLKKVPLPNQGLCEGWTQFGNVIGKLLGHTSQVLTYPCVGQFLDSVEGTFKQRVLSGVH
jgi:hypothetical protein